MAEPVLHVARPEHLDQLGAIPGAPGEAPLRALLDDHATIVLFAEDGGVPVALLAASAEAGRLNVRSLICAQPGRGIEEALLLEAGWAARHRELDVVALPDGEEEPTAALIERLSAVLRDRGETGPQR